MKMAIIGRSARLALLGGLALLPGILAGPAQAQKLDAMQGRSGQAVAPGDETLGAAPGESGNGAEGQNAEEGQGDAQPAPRNDMRGWRQVTETCRRDKIRLCPDLGPDASPRDEAMCLKFFKTSLELPCRGAVTAVTAVTR